MSRDARKPVFGISDQVCTNQSVQSQKMTRSLKFYIYVEEGLYYPCSENKGADQLRSYCTADLRFCFGIGENPFFSRCGSFVMVDFFLYFFLICPKIERVLSTMYVAIIKDTIKPNKKSL